MAPFVGAANFALGRGAGVTGALEVEGLSLTWAGTVILFAIGGRVAGVGRSGGAGTGGRVPAAPLRATSLLRDAPRAIAGKGKVDDLSFPFVTLTVFLAAFFGNSVRGGSGLDDRDFPRLLEPFSPRRGFLVVETQSLVLLKWRRAMNVSTAHTMRSIEASTLPIATSTLN